MTRIESLPLFLLNSVLFPDDVLPLRVFETRYMDMVSRCLKTQSPFGVCLLESGREVGELGVPTAVGTLAVIERCDMKEAGVLSVRVRGDARFEIVRRAHSGKLAIADVDTWLPEDAAAIPERFLGLTRLLEQILREISPGVIAPPHRLDDAGWVGMRLAHFLPVSVRLKQQWLELRDPIARLAAIRAALDSLPDTEDA